MAQRRKEPVQRRPGENADKVCSRCDLTQPITEFYVTRYGRQSWCRDCLCGLTTDLTRRLRQETIAAYGATCACCGEERWQFLSIDHVNGGGNAHRRSITRRHNGNMNRWLKRRGYPREGFQLLCHNCNQAKGHYGECPHETERRMRAALVVV